MKRIFTLLLIVNAHYSKAQTCTPLDFSFGVNGKAAGFNTTGSWINVRNLMVQPDGKILQVSSTPNSGFMAVRYNANGSPDNGYGVNSIAVAFSGQNTEVARGVLQSDGKLVTAGLIHHSGSSSDVALARFNVDGILDNTFGTGGTVVVSVSPSHDAAQGLAIQPDGKIVVAGYSWGSCFNDCMGRQFCLPLVTLLRFNSNGSIDSAFGQNGRVAFAPGSATGGTASTVLIQPDGKIIAVGDIQNYSCGVCNGGITTASGLFVARFLPNGIPDNGFGQNGLVMDTLLQSLSTALLQPDGRIVIAAQTRQGDFLTRRYHNNGSVDNAFFQNRVAADWIKDMLLLPDGKLALAGRTTIANQGNFLVLRLKNNGVFDSSFNGTGRLNLRVGVQATSDEGATGLARQDTLLLVGGFTQVYSSPNTVSERNQVVVRLGAALAGIPVSVSPAGPHYPCSGETVTLSPTSAGAYQWYRDGVAINGATGSTHVVAASGTYTVSVSNTFGCGISHPVLVQYNSLPVLITPLSSLNFCNGDSVKLHSNEVGAVQWYKDNVAIAGATDTIYAAKSTGAYHVTVKNGKGCGQSLPVSVTESSSKPVLQWDGAKLKTASGYLSYRWYLNGNVIAGATSNVFSPTTTGLYNVTIADFGCDTTSNEVDLSCTVINVTKPVINRSGTTLNTSGNYTAYQWYRNDSAISGATSDSYKPMFGESGAYKVRVANSIGCSDTSEAVLYTAHALVLGDLFLHIYPNPVKEKMMIEVSHSAAESVTAALYDLQGRRLLQQVLKSGPNTVPVYNLPAALYVLEVRYGKEKVVKAVVVR